MDRKSESVLPSGPQSSRRQHSGTSVSNAVFGFDLAENQFQILNSDQTASAPRSTEQHQEGLVDPRTTRQWRWAMRGTASQETKTEEALLATASLETAQGICTPSGSVINPVAIDYSSQSVHSLSAGPSFGPSVHYLLEPGVSGGGDDSLYGDLICNKRISYAGPERSAGRPGTMPFGARTSACLPTQAVCISGPYGSASQQSHDPGCNTREEQSFVTTPP